MSDINYGAVTVSIPEYLTIPEQAGKLTAQEMLRLSNPPKGIGKACDEMAACIEKCGSDIVLPSGFTPTELRSLGEQAEKIDLIIDDLEVLRRKLMQANSIITNEAFKSLRRVYGLVKSEVAFDPSLKQSFQPAFDYFAVYANSASQAVETTSTEGESTEELASETAMGE